MEAIRLKLLVPACCPNCGYNLQPDNPAIPVKLMHADDTSNVETVEGLFNFVNPPQVPARDPPKAPKWPRFRTPPRERRSPYEEEEPGRRSRRSGRGRTRSRKPKFVPEVGPPINFIQKRLLKIASEDVDVKVASPEPDPPTQIAVDRKTPKREVFGSPVPAVQPAIPHIQCSVPCNQYNQNEVYQLLTEFLEDVDTQQPASPRSPAPQIPYEAPRPTKIPWQAKRVLKSENFGLETGDPPLRNPFSAAPATGFVDPGPPAASVPVPAPVERGRVVAIHNHFYGETVVIPDTP